MSADKRGAPRKNIRWGGIILDTDGAVVTQCTMVDVSASGAKLAVKKPSALPNTFNLLLSKKGGVRRQCEVVWRADKTVENEAISYMNNALARIEAMNETEKASNPLLVSANGRASRGRG
jgi:PilZ domain